MFVHEPVNSFINCIPVCSSLVCLLLSAFHYAGWRRPIHTMLQIFFPSTCPVLEMWTRGIGCHLWKQESFKNNDSKIFWKRPLGDREIVEDVIAKEHMGTCLPCNTPWSHAPQASAYTHHRATPPPHRRHLIIIIIIIIIINNTDDEISPSVHDRINLINTNTLFGWKPYDGRIRPKHVVVIIL